MATFWVVEAILQLIHAQLLDWLLGLLSSVDLKSKEV
jgi:hypothetical protein